MVRGLARTHALGALLVVALLQALARPAVAEDLSPPLTPAARERYEAGLAHYAARRFPEAIQALRAAYALEPRREILFAEAQATRLGGDCAAAVPLYQRFLDSDPPARQLEAARIALARCRDAAAAPPPAAPLARTATAPPAAPPEPVKPTPPPGPWYRDPTGAVLAGSAALALGVGTGFLIAAGQANDRADRQRSYGDYEVHRVEAESHRRTGRLLLLGGAILGAAAAGRYVWLGWSPGGREARLALGGRF
jgi:tetratricopeptide (TPR) repeat protein